MKLIGVNDGIALVPSRHDQKGSKIPPIEHWCSTVEKSHVDASGKYLSLSSTLAAIREDWNTDNRVEGYILRILRIASTLVTFVKKPSCRMRFINFFINS